MSARSLVLAVLIAVLPFEAPRALAERLPIPDPLPDAGAPLLDRDREARGAIGSAPSHTVLQNLDLVGRGSRLLPGGTTDVWAHGRYAYVGTFQAPCGDGTGANGSGIRIYDVGNPHKVVEAGRIPSVSGSRCNDVKVARMNSGDVLVHSNESCGGGPGGIEVWDVDDPLHPVPLAHIQTDDVNLLLRDVFGVSDLGVHNLFLFTQGTKDYVAAVVEGAFGNFQIFDITDPASPVRVGFWGPEQVAFPGVDWVNESSFGVLGPAVNYVFSGYGVSANRALHDITISEDGTKAWLSNWDAGLVLLDISDPADPRPVSIAVDPTREDGEVNSHAAWPTADGRVVVETDEDFNPFGLRFEITTGPAAGEYPAREAFLTAPLIGLPDGTMSGPTTYVGTACTADGAVPPAPGPDAIALVQVGGCELQEQAANVVAAGYAGIVAFPDASGGLNPPFLSGPGVSIPVVAVGRLTGLAVAGVSAPIELVVGQAGQSIEAVSFPDGWGSVRIWDYADPQNPVLASIFDTTCSLDPLAPECDPRGTYSVHNVIVEDRKAYISWYSDGVLVLDIGDPYAPREIARYHGAGPAFEAQNGGIQDVWGIYKIPNQPWIYASDRNGGLYVFKEKGIGSAAPGLAAAGSASMRGSRRLTVRPNPISRTGVAFDFALRSRGTVAFDIVDVGGRLVARVPAGARGPGNGTAGWDGRDRTGARVASGVYWVRMELNGRPVATEKLLIIQ